MEDKKVILETNNKKTQPAENIDLKADQKKSNKKRLTRSVGSRQAFDKTKKQSRPKDQSQQAKGSAASYVPKERLPLTIRTSRAVMVFRLIGWIGAGLALWFLLLNPPWAGTLLNNWSLVWSVVVLGLIVLGVIYQILRHSNNYYLLAEDRVVHYQGVLYQWRRNLRYPTLDQLSLQQSFLGKLFGYGTLNLESTETNKEMKLYAIDNPQYYLEVAKQHMPEAERF
ncbi:MAG: PH domain-containing protein [Candidatus Pacebacteria bacterium]|nr:PH domain-containing protein [Candidatus Paceibacterota bacterium]